jgi:hypothetical protein
MIMKQGGYRKTEPSDFYEPILGALGNQPSKS